MNARGVFALAALSCALLSTSAQAATITQRFAGHGPQAYAQFDPALGTLNSVTAILDVSVLWDGQLFFQPPPQHPEDPPPFSFATGEFSESRYDAVSPYLTVSVVQDGDAGFPIMDDGQSVFQVYSTRSESRSALDVTPFIGTGTVTFNQSGDPGMFELSLGPDVYGDANLWHGQTFGFLTLTYEFTPIPEPSTLALLLIGAAAGVSFLRYRAARLCGAWPRGPSQTATSATAR